MNQEKIGKFISELRKEKKLTQEQLAEKIFMDRATISKWERGLYIANPEILLKLCEIFDVSVNEILVGERENKKNQEIINKVSIKLLKENRKKEKKIKHILLFGIILIFFLILSFFVFYFINNYNSISVYKIFGKGDKFYMTDGLMVLSREKAYIKLGDINGCDKKYDSIRLYYMIDGKEIDLMTSNDPSSLLTNFFGYDEFFSYKNINILKQNLFLEIIYDNNQKENINLKLVRDFSNSSFYSKNEFTDISNGQVNENISEKIPKYIENNFKFDSSQNAYYLNDSYNGKEINQIYLVDTKTYIVDEIDGNSTNHFEYSLEESIFTYSCYDNTSTVMSFAYDMKNKNCLFGNCSSDNIDYFIAKYYKFNILN